MEKEKVTKFLIIIMIISPIILIDFNCFSVDSYFLIKTGNYIIDNGFPHTDILSMHNFPITVQNWLSCVLFFILYKIFGKFGMLIYTIICTEIIMFLIYKICYNNCKDKLNSLILTFVSMILSIQIFESRPQLISMIFILLTILILDKYSKENNWKTLLFIPIITILQVNFHASMYAFIFAVIFCYLFNLKFFTTENIINNTYKKMPIIITLIISIICLFINPYGLSNVLYLFKSNSNNLSLISAEMKSASIDNSTCFFIWFSIIILIVIFYKTKNKIYLPHLLFLIGSFIVSMLVIKNIILLTIALPLFLSSYFKDGLDSEKLIERVFGAYKVTFIFILILLAGYRIKNLDKYNTNPAWIRSVTYDSTEALNFVENNIEDNSTIYANILNGTYLEFIDMKSYIDLRTEMFLESQNKEKDYLNEYLLIQFGKIDAEKFMEEYNFDYYLVDESDTLYRYLNDSEKYTLIFTDSNNYYKIYKAN